VRIPVGQWLKEHAVDKRENGGIATDTDGERKDGYNGETGIPTKSPKSIVKILHDGIECWETALIAVALLR